MPNVNLAEIKTRDKLNPGDNFNMEVIQGKFSLSYHTTLSALNSFFLPSNDIKAMTGALDKYWVWLDNLANNNELMDKETMDNKFLLLTDAKFYYKRLLTDEVMEQVCSEYATEKMLSALLDLAKTKGQYVATELANALSWQAAIVKGQAVMNDTDIQLSMMEYDNIMSSATIIGDAMAALANKIAELESSIAEMGSSESGGSGGGGEGGTGGSSNATLLRVVENKQKGGWVVQRKKPGWSNYADWWGRSTKEEAVKSVEDQMRKHPGAYAWGS